jgi:DNA topoisomerase-1
MAEGKGTKDDPRRSARSVGLRYVTDAVPGLRRSRSGKGFRYLYPGGRPVRDRATLARLKSLAIPPAWTDVWICPWPEGHLQVTGRDARGRKQYRYHTRWREVRDQTKFSRMMAFAELLPHARQRVARDLRRPGLPREKVLAAVVRLLEVSLVRVGNEEYARQNGSFGLTTLRDRHAIVAHGRLRLRFRGKGGKQHTVAVDDPRLARIVGRCQDIPGQELFQYLDEEGRPQAIGSADVNQYLRMICGDDFTAKDFRTWAGTVLAARALRSCGPAGSQAHGKRNIVRAIAGVAERLGNTPAVCRKSYVHPAILDAYLAGALGTRPLRPRSCLPADEAAVLAQLRGIRRSYASGSHARRRAS